MHSLVQLAHGGRGECDEKDYFLQLITGLLTSRPSNSICVVLQANRASETKQRK